MSPRRHLVTLLFVAWLAGCQSADEERFQGYVEGEPVLVAAQQGGQLTSLTVQRGDEIKAGMPLFSQDQAPEAAGVSQAKAQLAQAQVALEQSTIRLERKSQLSLLPGLIQAITSPSSPACLDTETNEFPD